MCLEIGDPCYAAPVLPQQCPHLRPLLLLPLHDYCDVYRWRRPMAERGPEGIDSLGVAESDLVVVVEDGGRQREAGKFVCPLFSERFRINTRRRI